MMIELVKHNLFFLSFYSIIHLLHNEQVKTQSTARQLKNTAWQQIDTLNIKKMYQIQK